MTAARLIANRPSFHERRMSRWTGCPGAESSLSATPPDVPTSWPIFESCVTDIPQPTLRILFQASLQQRANGGRCRARKSVPLGLAIEDGHDGVRHRVALERDVPGQRFVQHATECPDVGPFVDGLAPRLLRAHVGGGAEDHALLGHRRRTGQGRRGPRVGARRRGGVERLRQAEVQHLHHAVWPHFDVRGLEIAVDDALLVRRFERLGDLRRDRPGVGQRQRSLRDPIGKCRARHKLEHERMHSSAVFEAVDVADVRMIERREHLRFTPEAGEAAWIVRDGGQQDFDRDVAIELRVARLVDLAHAARADPHRERVRADALALEVFRHLGIVESNGRRVEKALRTLVRCEQPLDLLTQRVIVSTGRRDVRRAGLRRQRPSALEDLFQARPVVGGSVTRPGSYSYLWLRLRYTASTNMSGR